jgi:hypothetical protein
MGFGLLVGVGLDRNVIGPLLCRVHMSRPFRVIPVLHGGCGRRFLLYFGLFGDLFIVF